MGREGAIASSPLPIFETSRRRRNHAPTAHTHKKIPGPHPDGSKKGASNHNNVPPIFSPPLKWQ